MSGHQQDDRRVVRALGGSVLLRPIDNAITRVWQSAEHSRVALLVNQGRGQWQRLSSDDRHVRIAAILWSAAAAHVTLVLWHEIPAGWLWLVLPGLAVSLGVVLSSRTVRRPE
jgi:hypothetical protein